MAFSRIDDTIVVVHGQQRPAPDEWTAYVRFAGEQLERYGQLKILVDTGGAGPSAVQRGELSDLVGERTSKVAVLNESPIIRGMAKAFAWIGVLDVRVFAPDDLATALVYLESNVPKSQILARFGQMRDELAGPRARRAGGSD